MILFYEVQGQTKLTYGDRIQNIDFKGVWGFSKSDRRELLRIIEMFYIFTGVMVAGCIYQK